MPRGLTEKVLILRDEVLNLAEVASHDSPPGEEVFDAVLRRLDGSHLGDVLDPLLEAGVSERLAWGESELAILDNVDHVCRRLYGAAERSFRDPQESAAVIQATMSVACDAAKVVALAGASRAERARASHMREEVVQGRLKTALESQKKKLSED